MMVPSDYWPAPGEQHPAGYRLVAVVLTEREYEHFLRLAALLPSGVLSAAIRQAAGLKQTPYGYKAALAEQRVNARSETPA